MSLNLDLIYSQFNFKVDKSNKSKIYEFEKFRLDAVHLMLYHNGEEIPLVPKAVETLLALVEKRGEILSKDELMETIWTDSVVEESNLAQYLHLLRKTLGKTKDGKPFIETFRRRGYRFNGEVHAGDFSTEIKQENVNQNILLHPALTDGGVVKKATSGKVVALADWRHEPQANVKPTQTILPVAQIFPTTEHKRVWLVGAIVFGLLILALGFFAFTKFRSETPTADTPITAIAVLPFENASGDADLDYLSDGLSESVIDRLSQLPQLKVIARSSSFKYRGRNIDFKEAANALGVQAIVTGRVVRRGDDLSIRIEMVDGRDNKQLWGEQFNRKATDAFAVQQEIVQTVSEKLRLKLLGVQQQQFTKRETVNPLAYDLLLKGRFQSRKGGTDNRKKAIEYYQQAIAADPNYALAYARLSATYQLLVGNSILDPQEFLPKAQAAAQKSLELDESLAEAHLAFVVFHRNAWDWEAADQRFKRAIELNPNSSNAHGNYAYFLSLMGRHEQALAEAGHATELDPFSLYAKTNVGAILLLARRYDEALAETKKVLQLDKNFIIAYNVLGFTYLRKGMFRESIAAFQEAIRLGENSPSNQIYLGAAYAGAGEREKAQAILKQLATSKEYVSPGELTVLYVALDEREKAFASLEKARSAHDSQLQFLKVESGFDPLRSDSRFQDLMRRVGLPQ